MKYNYVDFYVKKPECPARKSGPTLKGGDKWPSGIEAAEPPSQNGFFFRRSPVRKHGILHRLAIGHQNFISFSLPWRR
jgi:hypothetical protein